jgi:hypothetical protein
MLNGAATCHLTILFCFAPAMMIPYNTPYKPSMPASNDRDVLKDHLSFLDSGISIANAKAMTGSVKVKKNEV